MEWPPDGIWRTKPYIPSGADFTSGLYSVNYITSINSAGNSTLYNATHTYVLMWAVLQVSGNASRVGSGAVQFQLNDSTFGTFAGCALFVNTAVASGFGQDFVLPFPLAAGGVPFRAPAAGTSLRLNLGVALATGIASVTFGIIDTPAP